MVPRTFSLVCFRLKPPVSDPDNGYTLNSTLVEALNSKGSILITHTVDSSPLQRWKIRRLLAKFVLYYSGVFFTECGMIQVCSQTSDLPGVCEGRETERME